MHTHVARMTHHFSRLASGARVRGACSYLTSLWSRARWAPRIARTRKERRSSQRLNPSNDNRTVVSFPLHLTRDSSPAFAHPYRSSERPLQFTSFTCVWIGTWWLRRRAGFSKRSARIRPRSLHRLPRRRALVAAAAAAAAAATCRRCSAGRSTRPPLRVVAPLRRPGVPPTPPWSSPGSPPSSPTSRAPSRRRASTRRPGT
jgi:hypothetical protein